MSNKSLSPIIRGPILDLNTSSVMARRPYSLLIGLLVLVLITLFTPLAQAKESVDEEQTLSNDWKLSIGGRLQLDYDSYDGLYRGNEAANGSEVRRLRLSLEAKWRDQWKAKLGLAFEDSEETYKTKDAFVAYKGFEPFNLTLGKMKEPFGLERLTSSKAITAIERSMASTLIAPGRSVGIMANGDLGDTRWWLGAYDTAFDEDRSSLPAFTGRLVYTPIKRKDQVLHFGAAWSKRDYGDEKFELEDIAEVSLAEEIVDSDKFRTSQISLKGLEAAWSDGPFTLQSEWMGLRAKPTDGENEEANFWGAYVQATYRLTGESLPYKKGTFGLLRPSRASGAWELLARYSVLDAALSDEGTKTDVYTLGINYYYKKHLRVMANLLHMKNRDKEGDKSGSGNALSIRMQLLW